MGHVDINYIAVLVSALAAFIIGGIWYGPLFGKAWMAAVGKTEEEIKKNFNPAKTYGLSFLGHIVVAYVLARLCGYVDADTIGEGLRLAFLLWLGFTAATFFINELFEAKSFKLLIINIGFYLVFVLVASVILVSWR
ncbi:MAG: DUF1761 domain-containing protein [Ignavibacteria bacterium]|jgi:hypothetical protein